MQADEATSAFCEADRQHDASCAVLCPEGAILRVTVRSDEGVQVSGTVSCAGVSGSCFGETSCTDETSPVGLSGRGVCWGGFPDVSDRWRTLHLECRAVLPDPMSASP